MIYYILTAKLVRKGESKKVSEKYIINSETPTEAESKLYKEIGESCEQLNITSAQQVETIRDVEAGESTDIFYQTTIGLLTLDEKSGMEKVAPCKMFIPADSFESAYVKTKEYAKELLDCVIIDIKETKIKALIV